MSQKRTINLAVPEPLLDEFNEVCSHYGHAKQKGLVLSAAILMFLEAHPQEQGKALERILVADVRSGIQSMIERARRQQAERVAHAEPAPEPTLRAAKTAGELTHGLSELPELTPSEPEQPSESSRPGKPPGGGP